MPDLPVVNVTLTWNTKPGSSEPVVIVDPAVIQVSPGQSIHFIRAGNAPGRMRVTFQDKDFVDCRDGIFQEGDGDVTVKDITRRTTFLCELLDANGNPIARSPVNGGGTADPEKQLPTG
jgi:hypothetical protein